MNNLYLKIIFINFIFFCNTWCKDIEMCKKSGNTILFVFCLDGFKNEYFKYTPYLNDVRKKGATTNLLTLNLSNAFATLHTVATGLSPFKHKVLGHKFQTSDEAGTQRNYAAKSLYHNDTLPIWNLNEEYNGISACMMWPGCELRYGDDKHRATYMHEYKATEDFEARFKAIIKWVNKTNGQPNLIMIYIEEPDKTAHKEGTNSEAVINKLKELDTALKEFEEELLKLKPSLKKRMNQIFFSDHSMWNLKGENMLDMEPCKFDCKNQFNLFLDEVSFQFVNNQINKSLCAFESKFNNYMRYPSSEPSFGREIDFNYINAWIFVFKKGGAWKQGFEDLRLNGGKVDTKKVYGVHGYLSDNHAIFIAKGPLFITGSVSPFKMHDFYSLIAKALGIRGQYNRDGSFLRVKPIFLVKTYQGVNWQYHLAVILACAILHCLALYFYGNAVEALEKAENAKKTKKEVELEKDKEETKEGENMESVDNISNLEDQEEDVQSEKDEGVNLQSENDQGENKKAENTRKSQDTASPV